MRIGVPPRDLMSPEQVRVHDEIRSGPRGKVEGPLQVWLSSPEFAQRAQFLGEFCRFKTSLEARLSELAILVCGAFWQSGFEWAVHAPIALAAGLEEAVIEAVRTGEVPPFQREDEAALYAFSSSLLQTRLVPQSVFDAAVTQMGERGVVDLVGILGYYSLVCMSINAFVIPPPEGTDDPFPGNIQTP